MMNINKNSNDIIKELEEELNTIRKSASQEKENVESSELINVLQDIENIDSNKKILQTEKYKYWLIMVNKDTEIQAFVVADSPENSKNAVDYLIRNGYTILIDGESLLAKTPFNENGIYFKTNLIIK